MQTVSRLCLRCSRPCTKTVGACERKPSLTETEEQSSDDCAVEFSHVGLTYQGAGENTYGD